MPKCLYYCNGCNSYFTRLVSYEKRNEVKCPKCEIKAVLKPSSPDITVYEKVDPYRNKSVKRDINKVMQDRATDYVKNHELGEFISKHGLKAAKDAKLVKGDK